MDIKKGDTVLIIWHGEERMITVKDIKDGVVVFE